jgi:D-inositol-3-phosphate glycosyltransferase
MADPIEQQIVAHLRAFGNDRPRGEIVMGLERMVGHALGASPFDRRGAIRGPDFLIETPDATTIAVELRITQGDSLRKNLSNNVSALLANAVEARRSFNEDVSLVAVLLINFTAADTEPTLDAGAMWSPLLRDASGAGYDAVVVGTVTSVISWEAFRQGAVSQDIQTNQIRSFVRNLSRRTQRRVVESAKGDRKYRFLMVSDEWSSSRGGISTVNRELATALASDGYDVAVLVPRVTDDDLQEASDARVSLAVPAAVPGLDERSLLLLRPVFADPDWKPDFIVGHGRILGPFAAAQQQQFFPEAKRIHFVHMDAEELEAAKERSGGESRMQQADERRILERELAQSADLVVGIGPALTTSIRDDLMGPAQSPPVLGLVPGLRSGWVAKASEIAEKNRVLVIGRADDFHSKGIDLAAEALLDVSLRWPKSDPHRPTLVIRGVPNESSSYVKKELEGVTSTLLDIYLRPYTQSEDEIVRDLAQAKVVLMPSRHEGFGLAAWEAIAAGVPVLVSENSGLARVLRETRIDTTPSSIVQVRDADGKSARQAWEDAISRTLADPVGARKRALELRLQIQESFTWQRAVKELTKALA